MNSCQVAFDQIWILSKKESQIPSRSTASHSKLLMLIKGHVYFTCHLKFSSVNFQVSHLTVHVPVTVEGV